MCKSWFHRVYFKVAYVHILPSMSLLVRQKMQSTTTVRGDLWTLLNLLYYSLMQRVAMEGNIVRKFDLKTNIVLNNNEIY